MVALLHFKASWAEAICSPHRSEVATAAGHLGLVVIEHDADLQIDLARAYGLRNVPSVAIEGRPETLIVGAVPADQLEGRLRVYLGLP